MSKRNHNLGYFDLSEHDIQELVFVREGDLATVGDLYYWRADQNDVPWEARPRDARQLIPQNTTGRVIFLYPFKGPLGDGDTDHFFAFYCADCFDPPLSLVTGRDESSAYEEFLNYASKNLGLRIDPYEYADYDIQTFTTSDGQTGYNFDEYEGAFDDDDFPVDDSSIQFFPLRLLRITLK